MSNSKNGLDAFERSLRESLDQFEVPYNSADWSQMERTLDGGRRGWWMSGVGISALVAGLIVIGSGVGYMLSTHQGETASVTDEVFETKTTTHSEGSIGVPAGAPADESSTLVSAGGSSGSANDAPTPSPVEVDKAGNSVRTSTATTTTSAGSIEAATGKPEGAKAGGADPGTGAGAPDEIGFKASVSEGCPGTAVEFKVSNMPEDGIYLWNFGDGSFSNKANPAHTFTKPGSYQVMLSMSAAGVGTIQNKPSSDIIVIHEAPMAAFNVLKQEYDGHLPSVHFENRSLAGKQYHWDFGDGQTSSIAHPDHIYKKKGVYQVELTVTNEIGCEDKIMKDVRIEKDYNLDAPASFSPDGDDFQETFMPEALRTLGVKFMLTVYAPNGTLLYQTNDASKPWTGRPQNRGDLCGAGEYVWVVDVRESLHLAETYTGKVKLER